MMLTPKEFAAYAALGAYEVAVRDAIAALEKDCPALALRQLRLAVAIADRFAEGTERWKKESHDI